MRAYASLMALALYSDTFWYPTGSLAANVAVRVFPENSSSLAPLFADLAGTIPLANPAFTDGSGVLSFYATVDRYWLRISGETFPVDVGMSEEQADLATGIASGGSFGINAMVPTSVDIGATVAYVVDNVQAGPESPGIVRVDVPAQTVALDGPGHFRQLTYWGLDASGSVIQQANRPTPDERRTAVPLGVTFFNGVQLVGSRPQSVLLAQSGNQFVDLADSLGPFVLKGGGLSANGANLMVNQASGFIFHRGFNAFTGTNPNLSPHVSQLPAQSPAGFRHATQAPSSLGPSTTIVDVGNYDVGGVITPVGGGANTATVFRVFTLATMIPGQQLVLQYGQATHASLSTAKDAIGSGTYTVTPVGEDTFGNRQAALVGYLIVTRTATDLSDPTQATFLRAGKFDVL